MKKIVMLSIILFAANSFVEAKNCAPCSQTRVTKKKCCGRKKIVMVLEDVDQSIKIVEALLVER